MDRLRTFGIVAHIDAGKTTLTERILHDTGAQAWVGSVDEGTASMDWMPAERTRGISIAAAATRVDWGDHVLQIVDTPGHVDFVAEVERCMHVLDGVVVLIDAVRGVESRTEAVWQQAASRGLPRLVFVNKLDRAGADFDAVVDEVRERMECAALPLVIPLRDDEGRFAGLGDAVTGAVQWFDGRPTEAEVPRLRGEILAANERVVEAAADGDDAILADVLAGQAIEPRRVRAALRSRFLGGSLVPVLGGAALWNRGVDWLLDAVVAFMPDLRELPRTGLWAVDRAGDDRAPFCGFVFKVQHHGEVRNFVRVVRGVLAAGVTWCLGRSPASTARSGELWLVQADRHSATQRAVPGEIVVLPGELGLRTGDTLCDPRSPLELPTPRFPAPVLAVTFEPLQAGDAHALADALRELAIDDPTLRVDVEEDSIVVRGMGELHLDIVADLVRQRTSANFRRSRLRVDRREGVVREGVGEAEVRALVAGTERSARCALTVTPVSDEQPASIVAPPDDLAVAAAADEIRSRLRAGLRVGPVYGARVVVREVVAQPGTSDALVQQAAAKALAQGLEAAGLVELEPWVRFELWAPEEASAAVLADLGARGALVSSVSSGRLGARLHGRAPLGRMLGYVTKLRSMTKGRGEVALAPAGFAPTGSLPSPR